MENLFNKLSIIDLREFSNERGGLTYLSWAKAWGLLKATCPEANYRIKTFNEYPYLHDPLLGYMVFTEVTANGETLPMHLVVLDHNNMPLKSSPYTYQVKEYKQGAATGKMIEKTVPICDMADINNSIMRCLTKNISLFGIGHQFYLKDGLTPQYFSGDSLTEDDESIRILQNKIKDIKDNVEFESFTQDKTNAYFIKKYPIIKSMLTKKKIQLS